MNHILLVEDDRQNYEMMQRRLKRRDYKVTLAVDGEEAVDKAREAQPDLILMDIKLPKQDGLEATRQIRRFPRAGKVPVIALTAHAMTEDKDKALQAGCDDYHSKPVSFSQLVRQIDGLIENGEAISQ